MGMTFDGSKNGLNIRSHRYAAAMSAEALEGTLRTFDHSPEANQLIRRFMQIVFT